MKKINNKKNNEEKNNENTKKVILIIIAIIIIVLALITSCSCTSKFWGRIGDMFRNEKTYVFKEREGAYCENSLYCETIINKELRFDKDYLDVSVSEENIKLSYTYSKINPEELTCTTSDAEIATCYVNKDGYVVINPKKEGKVTVILQTKENDRIYQAMATINIGKPTKGIVLSSNAGTINLKKTNVKAVSYRLVGIDGKISVTSSDESVATATIKDGILTMTAKKTGKVTFTITVEDNGKTYTATYTLTVVSNAGGSSSGNQGGSGNKPGETTKPNNKDSNNRLSDLTTDKGKLTPVFNENTKKYSIDVAADVNDLTLTATPSSKKATVTYTFDGKTNTSGKIEGLKPGANVVTITVKAEDGSTNIYTVVINKAGTPPVVNHDSSLERLTTSEGDVSPAFDPNVTKGYIKEVDADTTSIKVIANPKESSSTVKYTYYDPVKKTTITNETGEIENLQPGDTEVKVTVTAEDGKTETEYFVTIKRPHKYEIEFENPDAIKECYLEDIAKNGYCKVLFTASKDGVEQHNIKPNEISLNITGSYSGTYEIVSNNTENYILLKPNLNETAKDSEIKLNLTYNGVTTDKNVKFKTENYYLNNQKDKYSMSTDEVKSVVFETNIFEFVGGENKDLSITCSKGGLTVPCNANKDHITIKSNKTGQVYLDVWSVGDKIENIEIKPDGSNYISVSVTANGAGKAEIHAKGSVFGTELNEVKSEIEIIQKYLVTISAGEGIFENLFDESSKEYEFKISSTETIDLSDFDEPIKKAQDDCYYYEFIGYVNADDPNDFYSKEDINNKKKNIITGITKPTKYIAQYKEIAEKREVIENKLLWAVDIPLFENDEYFEKYGEKKIIYPGAKGSHTMEFKNETGYDIILKGMILEEDTICITVDGKLGCLNMAYIVNSDYDNQNVNNFLYGASNKPTILYKDPYTENRNAPLPLYTYRREFSFDASTKSTMTLPAGSNKIVEITIHWEWIFEIDDFNNKVDTAIGNQAAASAKDETINDKYKLKVGIIYDAINKACTSIDSKD